MHDNNDKNTFPSPDDWRRQGQERFLHGVKLIAKDYREFSVEWNHDHCEFCGGRFSLKEGDLHCGYCTVDEYHWICIQCFNDFKFEFAWQLDSNENHHRP